MKNKNIWLIPSNAISRLYLWEDVLKIDNSGLPLGLLYRNIYITTDVEIKEESLTKEIYVIDIQNKNIGKLTCKNRFFKGSCKLIEIEWKNKQNIWNYNHIREIILTDNKDLINDGVQAIDNEFLEWFVKNPSCEEIQVEKVKIIDYAFPRSVYDKYKIVIPKGEPYYKSVIEQAAKDFHLTEVDILELMRRAYNAGYNQYNIVEAGLEGKDTETNVRWILTKYQTEKLENSKRKRNFYCGDKVDYDEQCLNQCDQCVDATGVDYGYYDENQ
jgi:hypothetical protein